MGDRKGGCVCMMLHCVIVTVLFSKLIIVTFTLCLMYKHYCVIIFMATS